MQTILKRAILLLGVGAIFATPSSKISANLLETLESKDKANIVINFVGSNKAVVSSIENQAFETRNQRLNTLKASLESHTQKSQKRVQDFLNSKSILYKSFWISNQIFIKDANFELMEAVLKFPEIESIYEEHIIALEPPVQSKAPEDQNLAWGITRIQAEEAWRITNGSGIVVANIDTGVRSTHEALRDNFRSDYGWFDPYEFTEIPYDFFDFCRGSLAGSNSIGVAPGAQWIACRGCYLPGCGQAELTACGQWALCPTKANGSNADCSKAPALVSNSWGGRGGNTFYEPVTEAWIAAGIVGIFATGNEGPACGHPHSPGDMRRVIAVGSIDRWNVLSSFSSPGPTTDGRMKPELSAPGDIIWSALADSDTSYNYMSGTSMATPHASGVAALLLSVNPDLSFEQVYQALIDGCDRNTTSSDQTCGGIHDGTFPNHFFGWGVTNALKTLEAAKKFERK